MEHQMKAIREMALRQRTETHRYLCPKCSPNRRHDKEPCLAVTIIQNRAAWFCHHCGYKGAIKLHQDQRITPIMTTARQPIAINMVNSPERIYSWLANRGITSDTA